MESAPVMQFKSHIDGKNADVAIYPDRIEWEKKRGASGGKITAGVLTGGISLLATGVRGGKAGSEMIPVSRISSVTTKRDGAMYTKVVVITSGNDIEFRVSHGEAPAIKELLTHLVMGTHHTQNPAASQPVAHVQAMPPQQYGAPAQQSQYPAVQQPVQYPTPGHYQPVPGPVQDAVPDHADQLRKLGELRDAGILTPEEFEAKKADILSRM